MDINYNADVTSTNWVGDLTSVGCVLYHPDRIANILSLSKMSNQFSITYYSWDINAFEVHNSAGAIIFFVGYLLGLLYMDINNYHAEVALVTTVEDKNRITLLLTILVLNVPELSKMIMLDPACLNSSKLLKIIC